ncbi:hypothetical protein WME94_32060 [Sorangium sp. So ce429]
MTIRFHTWSIAVLSAVAAISVDSAALAQRTAPDLPGEEAAAAPEALSAPRPRCVEARHTSGHITQTVRIKNRCGHRVSYQVLAGGRPITPCLHVAPGNTKKHKWPDWQRYDGIRWGCD